MRFTLLCVASFWSVVLLCASLASAAPVFSTRTIAETWCVEKFAKQSRQLDWGSNARRVHDPVADLEAFIEGTRSQYILGI